MKYLYREILESLRYRMIWLNLFISPFFMFAPFVYLVEVEARTDVLLGMLCWYSLNQFFFGISNFISEERMIGTFSNLFLFPFNIHLFLLSKGFWILIQTLLISMFTLFLFSLLGIIITNLVIVIFILVLNAIMMYLFSVFYLSLVIQFKRLGDLNGVIQELIGFTSGYTSDISRYPSIIKLVSVFIPLTYMIVLCRNLHLLSGKFLLVPFILSLVLYLIGSYFISRKLNKIRLSGNVSQW